MMEDSFESDSLWKSNYSQIAENVECQKTILEFVKIEKFLSEFGFLSFGRDFILCQEKVFSLQRLAISVELTAGSIISCCKAGCMADANSLLRKFRDDMFFYLYIQVYDSIIKSGKDSPKALEMEHNIQKWIENNLSNLQISAVMKAIGTEPRVQEAVKKYGLQSYFSKVGHRLNNYVHGNGISYYNCQITAYNPKELNKQLSETLRDMRFITVFFLFLLTLCSPLSIMSTDYTDYLDFDMAPPEGSQYWVAPFVTQFFKENLNLIDENCMAFLKNETCMSFD